MKTILFEFSKRTSKSREMMCKVGILNLYNIHVQEVLTSMFRVKNQTITTTFDERFTQIYHGYPTGFSHESLN